MLGDLDSNFEEDIVEIVIIFEDEVISLESYSDSFEGWSDVNLDFDELFCVFFGVSEELILVMSMVMLILLILLMFSFSELGYVYV